METILLAITAVSLLVALIMSAAAWRMSREERARAAARVAALAAAASESRVGGGSDHLRQADGGPPKLYAKAEDAPLQVMAPVVPARVAAFVPARPTPQAMDFTLNVPVAEELPLRHVPKIVEQPAPSFASSPIADSFLSETSTREQSGPQRGLMVAAAMLFVLLGGGAYWTLAGGTGATSGVNASAAASHAPLELMSLRHERQGGRLSLSGLVRNPAAGAPIEELAAVAFLFDAQGGFISSARVGVDFKRLAPGDESPFVITVEAPSNVARYRVSFRTDAGVVAHVDRRTEQPVATAIVK
jgi:hypothetical protein